MPPPSQGKTPASYRVALFTGFGLLICAPLLGWLLRVSELPPQNEMRALGPWPEWRATKFAQWPAAFETWLNDHFPLRSRVLKWHGIVQHRWLGEPSSLVVVGRNNWLFYTGDKTVEDLLGRDRLSDAELVAWTQAVEGRRAWWREQGADYLLVIVPNKSTVHPENLPAFIRNHRQPGKLDQLIDHFKAQRVTAPFVDLRKPLQAGKGQRALYWPTDSHWNAEGLVVGCNAIMASLQTMGVAHRVRDEDSWSRSERVLREGDCVGLLRMKGQWPLEPITQLRLLAPPDVRVTPTPVSRLPVWQQMGPWGQPLALERESGVGRAVMLCDSFFRVGGMPDDAPLQLPLMLNFRRFVSIWPWIGPHNFATFDVVAAISQLERPTLVIEQWTERYLRTPPPDHPEFQRARLAAVEARRSASNAPP